MDLNVLQVLELDFIKKIADILPGLVGKGLLIVVVLLVWPRITKAVLNAYHRLLTKKAVDPLLESFTSSIVKTLLYIVLFFIVIGIAGVQAASIVTVLGTAGLAVGLALQGSLSNLAGGVLILFFRPFTKGDFISAGGAEGVVERIQILYTTLVTPDNRVIIIPNSQLANGTITNVTKNPERRLDLMFSVSYDTSIEKVKEILHKVVAEQATVLKDKEPTIRLSVHNASSLDFICRVWVKKEDYWNTKFDLMEIVKEEFDKNNIEIPYNKLDIYNK